MSIFGLYTVNIHTLQGYVQTNHIPIVSFEDHQPSPQFDSIKRSLQEQRKVAVIKQDQYHGFCIFMNNNRLLGLVMIKAQFPNDILQCLGYNSPNYQQPHQSPHLYATQQPQPMGSPQIRQPFYRQPMQQQQFRNMPMYNQMYVQAPRPGMQQQFRQPYMVQYPMMMPPGQQVQMQGQLQGQIQGQIPQNMQQSPQPQPQQMRPVNMSPGMPQQMPNQMQNQMPNMQMGYMPQYYQQPQYRRPQ